MPLSDLHEFRGHPFRVLDDEKMEETVQSIEEHGVLIPGIVKKREGGGYEIIAGHLQYVMECLRNNPNQKGIESYRNYKLTCLYNAPVTMDTYYQQRVNHDMNTGFSENTDDT